MVLTVIPLLTEFADDLCDNVADQIKRGVADHAVFMMPLAPEGIPAVDKAAALCEKYALLKAKLHDRGVDCGVLIQSTIGHSYYRNKIFSFARYTNLSDGRITDNVCPYDKEFQEYLRNALRTVALQHPSVIMVDDDFRLIARPGKGCACPMHMEAVRRLTGEDCSREELFERVQKSDPEGLALRQAFIETQRDALLQAARAMREGIDSVDKSIPGLFCGCGGSAELAAEIAAVLAGEGNPTVVRVGNGFYCSYSTKGISGSSYYAAAQRELLKDVDILLAETDTCPQSRYSTNAQVVHSHYTLSLLEGLKGAKHWITHLSSNETKSCNAYKKVLKKHNNFYKSLMELVPTLNWVGCRIPVQSKPDYGFNAAPSNAWYVCVLERLGLPLYFSAQGGGMVFLDEFDPHTFSDSEIKQFFRDGVFLSAKAAQTLIDMGYADCIGVSFEPWEGLAPTYERMAKKGTKCRLQKDMQAIVLRAEGVRVDSVVYNCIDSVNETALFPGSTVFDNPLGGKTVVFAGTPRTAFSFSEAFSFLSETRKQQLVDIMQSIGKLPVYYTEDEDVYFRAAEMPENQLFCSLLNLGVDPAEEISLCVDRAVRSVERLMPNGEWHACEFTQKGDIAVIETAMGIMDPVILRLA